MPRVPAGGGHCIIGQVGRLAGPSLVFPQQPPSLWRFVADIAVSGFELSPNISEPRPFGLSSIGLLSLLLGKTVGGFSRFWMDLQ